MNEGDTLYHGDTFTCQTKYDYVKGKKNWSLNTKPCHKPSKVVSSHGDRPICQIWYANVKANRSLRQDMKTLRSKVNIESGSWMYVAHRLVAIHPCAKYGKPMTTKKKLWAGDEDMSKTPLSLRSKFKVVSGSWMYTIHYLMAMHPCAKYGKPMSNQI